MLATVAGYGRRLDWCAIAKSEADGNGVSG